MIKNVPAYSARVYPFATFLYLDHHGRLYAKLASQSLAFSCQKSRVFQHHDRGRTQGLEKERCDAADVPLLIHSPTTAIIKATPAPRDVVQCGGLPALEDFAMQRGHHCVEGNVLLSLSGNFPSRQLTTRLATVGFSRRVECTNSLKNCHTPYATKTTQGMTWLIEPFERSWHSRNGNDGGV
jgi:hypothetical protein